MLSSSHVNVYVLHCSVKWLGTNVYEALVFFHFKKHVFLKKQSFLKFTLHWVILVFFLETKFIPIFVFRRFSLSIDQYPTLIFWQQMRN